MDQLENHSENPEALRQELLHSFTAFEKNFRRSYPLTWLATLIGPAVLTIAVLAGLGFIFGWGYPQKLISHAILTAAFLGRFVILVGIEGVAHESFDISLRPSELFMLVTYMDVVAAVFVAFHMGILFRLPYIGD